MDGLGFKVVDELLSFIHQIVVLHSLIISDGSPITDYIKAESRRRGVMIVVDMSKDKVGRV